MLLYVHLLSCIRKGWHSVACAAGFFFVFWLVPVKVFFLVASPFVCVIFCCRVAVPVTTDTAHTWIIIIIIVSLYVHV